MPWQSNDDLPEMVRSQLPVAALTRFRSAANAALEKGDSDAVAMQAGWDSVKDVEKIGARNSTLDKRRIQLMHDTAIELGAVCHVAEEGVAKAKEKTMYVKRNLLNAEPFIAWAKSQGFGTTLLPGDLHVTVAYSRAPMLWPDPITETLSVTSRDGRIVEPLGDGGAVVLKFQSPELLARWDYLRSIGASWDHPQYTPHVTISWDAKDVPLDDVAPYKGELSFGPEIIEELNEDWSEGVTEKGATKAITATVTKVDDELGIAFGWAIISTVKGRDYYDVQKDHIPERSMLRAAAKFMQGARVAGNMHRPAGPDGSVERIGTVVFAFPLTAEVAKKMGIASNFTGLMVGMKVDNPRILEKFKSGDYTGFSIGGRRIIDKDVEDGS